MITFPENPYNWDASSRSITSSVIDFSLKTKNGSKLKIAGLEKPVKLYIPRKPSAKDRKPAEEYFAKSGEDGTDIQYHSIYIPSDDVSVSIAITPDGNRTVVIYVSFKDKPTPENHAFSTILPNITYCQNHRAGGVPYNCTSHAYMFAISSSITGGTGLHYVGIRPVNSSRSFAPQSDKLHMRLRLRRDGGHSGRQKRSCIGTKEPPTTIPPTAIIKPSYNASTDVNYTMSVSVASCRYWSEKMNKWTSEGCKVRSLIL